MEEKRSKRKSFTEANYYLIGRVRREKYIYKFNHPDYSNDGKRKSFFSELARTMKIKFNEYKNISVDGDYIKKEWYSLRNSYRLALKATAERKNLTHLLRDAKNAMGFLEKWILGKGETRFYPGQGETDSEAEEKTQQILIKPDLNLYDNDSSSDEVQNDQLTVAKENEEIIELSSDDESSNKENPQNWSMVYLQEDEEAVFQYVLKKSMEDDTVVKNDNDNGSHAEFMEEMYEENYEECSIVSLPKREEEVPDVEGVEEKYIMRDVTVKNESCDNGSDYKTLEIVDETQEELIGENEKNPSMMYLQEDEEAELQYVLKKSLEENDVLGKSEIVDTVNDSETRGEIEEKQKELNTREAFDKQFSIRKTVKPDVDVKPTLMDDLLKQTHEMERIKLIQDRVNILCGIFKQLSVEKLLAALYIIDSIFEKHNTIS